MSLQTPEDQSIVIDIDDLIVDYPDHNPANLDVIIHDGEFYTYSGTTVAPSADFYGDLAVPITVTDGVLESAVFPLTITVTPVNDPPSVNAQFPLETLERTPIEITTAHLVLSDPDNNAAELSVRVLDGAGYQRVDNTITPEPGVVGAMIVRLVVNDGELNSAVFNLTVQVLADNVPPVIVVTGSPTVTIDQGDTYTDAGATATDNVDGDISDQIVVDKPGRHRSARYLHRHLHCRRPRGQQHRRNKDRDCSGSVRRRCPGHPRSGVATDAGGPVDRH